MQNTDAVKRKIQKLDGRIGPPVRCLSTKDLKIATNAQYEIVNDQVLQENKSNRSD